MFAASNCAIATVSITFPSSIDVQARKVLSQRVRTKSVKECVKERVSKAGEWRLYILTLMYSTERASDLFKRTFSPIFLQGP